MLSAAKHDVLFYPRCIVPEGDGVIFWGAFKANLWGKHRTAASAQGRPPGALSSKVPNASTRRPPASASARGRRPGGAAGPRRKRPCTAPNPPPRCSPRRKKPPSSRCASPPACPPALASAPRGRAFRPCAARPCTAVSGATASAACPRTGRRPAPPRPGSGVAPHEFLCAEGRKKPGNFI